MTNHVTFVPDWIFGFILTIGRVPEPAVAAHFKLQKLVAKATLVPNVVPQVEVTRTIHLASIK
jgi:hypothetical protein